MNKDFDIDNMLNDDELFKPITKGLGFHHSIQEKKDISISLKQKSLDLKKDLNQRTKELKKQNQDNLISNRENIDMGELAPFYNQNARKEELAITDLRIGEGEELELTSASLLKRVMAYALDLSLITILLASSLLGAALLSSITVRDLGGAVLDPMAMTLLISMSALFYVLYFSFFDKSQFSTIGKRVLGLKLISIRSEMTLMDAFLRSTLSLISLLSLGMLSLLKLEDKLTDTLVVEDE